MMFTLGTACRFNYFPYIPKMNKKLNENQTLLLSRSDSLPTRLYHHLYNML